MIARRALYVLLSVWSLPWFLLVAADQRVLLRAQDVADTPEHFAIAMGTWIVAVGCAPFALAALVLVVFVWGRTPAPVHRQIVAWFGLLAVVAANTFASLAGASRHATLGGRLLAGWIDVGLQASLLLLPLAFLAGSLLRRRASVEISGP